MKFLAKQEENEGVGDLNELKTHKLILDNLTECIWIFDIANKKFKYISPSIMNLMGLTVEEAINERIQDSLTNESLSKVKYIIKNKIKEYISGNKTENTFTNIYQIYQYCKDGSLKPIEINFKFILNEKTNYIDILGVSREVYKSKDSYQIIREKEDEIKKLIRSEKRLNKVIEELKRKNYQLKELAITDKLTDLYNRYFLEKKILKKLEYSDSNNIPLTLIFIDVDSFKQVNDFYGHDIGDKVLINVANIGSRIIKKTDIFARWGGDEFLILCTNTDISSARILAERIRNSVSLSSSLNLQNGHITISIGVAERNKFETFESWFKRADKSMYIAKKNGGNCVVI